MPTIKCSAVLKCQAFHTLSQNEAHNSVLQHPNLNLTNNVKKKINECSTLFSFHKTGFFSFPDELQNAQ